MTTFYPTVLAGLVVSLSLVACSPRSSDSSEDGISTFGSTPGGGEAGDDTLSSSEGEASSDGGTTMSSADNSEEGSVDNDDAEAGAGSDGISSDGSNGNEENSDGDSAEEEDGSPSIRFDVAAGEESGTDEGDCLPKETTCDGIDEDCNGVIDDVDVEGDGICDCLNILILGRQGQLAATVFDEWLTERANVATRYLLDDDTEVTAELLEPFHVLLVDWLLRDLTEDEISTIFDWINEDGRGMITMTGYVGNGVARDRTRTLTTPYGITYRQVPIYTEAAMMTPDLEINEGVGESIIFNGGYPVDTTGDGMVLGTSMDDPAGIAQEQGEGKVLVWGDEWISFDSEWNTTPEIPRMWANWLKWVQPTDFCDVPPPIE